MSATRRKAGEPRQVERSDKQKVPVSINGDRIEVKWDCQTRSFTVEDLRLFIDHVDLTAESKHPFSLTWQDSSGRGFWVRLKDGKLHAAQYFSPVESSGRVNSVSWATLKRAFQASIAELAKGSEES